LQKSHCAVINIVINCRSGDLSYVLSREAKLTPHTALAFTGMSKRSLIFSTNSLHYFMKLFIQLLLSCVLFATSRYSFAGKIFITDYASDSTAKVFITKYKSDANCIVYETTYSNDTPPGVWFYTKYQSEARASIYYTNYKSDADLIVFYTQYKSDANCRF